MTECKFIDDIQGSNCAEWECPKCLSRFVSPSVAMCGCDDSDKTNEGKGPAMNGVEWQIDVEDDPNRRR